MSILHDKILRAKALLAEQTTNSGNTSTTNNPLDRIGKPPPIPAKRPVPTRSNKGKTRSRGRPRSSLARRELELRPIEQWAHECLKPEPKLMEYVGTIQPRLENTTSGRKVRVMPEYGRQTLVESYLDYCRKNGFQPTVPLTFSGLIVEACLAFGWPSRLTKSYDLRRATIQGIALVGQPPFDGEDRRYGENDRQRWLPKIATSK